MIRILYFPLLVLSISSIVVTLTACQALHNESNLAEHSPKYLKAKLTRLLELARSPQTEPQLKRELEKSILNAQQVRELLREHPLRQKLGQIYERVIAKNAQQELLWTFQECAKLGYSRLEISRVGPQAGASNAHGDLALLSLLKSREGLYTVRLKRNESDPQALRMSGWFYDKDLGWLTLLKLGEEILDQSKRKQNDE